MKEWGKKKAELNTEFGGLPTVRWNGKEHGGQQRAAARAMAIDCGLYDTSDAKMCYEIDVTLEMQDDVVIRGAGPRFAT